MGDGGFKKRIIKKALKSNSCEIRNSAVGAIENWNDKNLLYLIKWHKDDKEWINEHIRKVVNNFEQY